MKNKTKKILAGICMGLALAGGTFTMTGCTDMLTQEQIDKLITVANNSDVFMEETLDLLESSNLKIDNEEAVNLYNYSINRLKLNKDNVWDNLIMSYSSYINGQTDMRMDYHYFKLNLGDGINVMYSKSAGSTEIADYHDSSEQPGVEEDGQLQSVIGSFAYYVQTSLFPTTNEITHEIVADEVAFCKTLENGNYQIEVTSNNFMGLDDEGIISCEVSKDGYLMSITYYTMVKMPVIVNGQPYNGGPKNYEQLIIKQTYQYGQLTEDVVTADIA